MEEVKALIDGHQRFYKQYFEKQRGLYSNLFEEGQSPKFLVISCCDSRVHPAQIMDTAPGDIFVIRNVANLVPINEADGKSHGTSAAMEFAVTSPAAVILFMFVIFVLLSPIIFPLAAKSPEAVMVPIL